VKSISKNVKRKLNIYAPGTECGNPGEREKKTKQRKMEATETRREEFLAKNNPKYLTGKKNSSFLFFFTMEDYSIAVARDGKTEN
jgi:hypothetical protein